MELYDYAVAAYNDFTHEIVWKMIYNTIAENVEEVDDEELKELVFSIAGKELDDKEVDFIIICCKERKFYRRLDC